jgi:hypothetical protein
MSDPKRLRATPCSAIQTISLSFNFSSPGIRTTLALERIAGSLPTLLMKAGDKPELLAGGAPQLAVNNFSPDDSYS